MSHTWGWVSIIVIVIALLFAATPSHAAAPSNVPVSDNCVLDSTIGVLDVFYCEGSTGVDYLVNSFGFVVVVD